jgi:carboxymethylenebutenolidase
MRVIKRILFWLLGILAALIVLLLGSVVVDGLLGRDRIASLTNITIPNGGEPEIRAFVARPTTPGPHPAVIMIHEWWGLRPDIVGKAQALADQGYVVVAPDAFRGSTTNWLPRALYQIVTTPAEQVDRDLDAVFAWLGSQADVRPDRIAIVGFCYGGGTSLRYSLGNGKFAATALFYGTPIADAEQLRALHGPVLGIFGGADAMIPVADVRAFEAALTQAGVPNQISIYDGQPHAFVKGMDEIRAGGPQQQAWNELLAFLDQSLKQPALAHAPRLRVAQYAETVSSNAFTPARALHVFVCDRAVRRES